MRLFVLLLLAFASPVFAFPQLLSLDGYLTNSSGSALNGSYSFVFSLYNNSTGGTALWTETQTLTVSSGKLNALLGSVTALNLPFDQDYYLGINVNSDGEMVPRYRIASSAYAYYSSKSAFSYASNPYALPVLAISFNEAGGQTARDFSGLSNHGTLGATAGAETSDPTWGAGKVGGALQFDGVDDYVAIGANSALNPKKITIAAWIYPTSLDVAKIYYFVNNWESATDKRSYALGIYTNKLRALLSTNGLADSGYITVVSAQTFSINTWYHVAVTFDGASGKLFINGIQDGEAALSGDLFQPTTMGVQIGKLGTNPPFNGTIDEFRIYNRALTANEIKALYEAGLQ